MSINLFKDKGVNLSQQTFTWKDLVQQPISKLNDDAFTRIRVILMNGIELEGNERCYHRKFITASLYLC